MRTLMLALGAAAMIVPTLIITTPQAEAKRPTTRSFGSRPMRMHQSARKARNRPADPACRLIRFPMLRAIARIAPPVGASAFPCRQAPPAGVGARMTTLFGS